jgi:shikimate dehydrogenase
MPALYGLIGFPLIHSFSPSYFLEKFLREGIDAVYYPFELQKVRDLPYLLRQNRGVRGLNVTIPHKESVIEFLDEVDETAEKIGAVNCIDIRAGKLKGYNTDAIGFEKSLLPLLKPHHTKALVLGTGGSSLAVRYVLDKLSIDIVSVSREKKDGALAYTDVDSNIIHEHTLIVNTTPLGMLPNVKGSPSIPYEALTGEHLLYDLVYNPAETAFLSQGRARGAVTKNGLEMLHIQADESWRIWSKQLTDGS